jgi:cyclic pyranopterin phosphate synthase
VVHLSLVYSRNRSLYINPCSRCTNNCIFCVRNFSNGVFGFNLTLETDPTPKQISNAIQDEWNVNYNDIAIVGFGEPLINIEGTLAAARTLRTLTYRRIRINTNGQALLIHPNRDIPKELAQVGISRIQVSLNAQDADTYEKICKPRYGALAYPSIIEFTKRCRELMEVEISVLDLPGVNIDACHQIANSLDVEFRIRNFKGPREVLDELEKLFEQ